MGEKRRQPLGDEVNEYLLRTYEHNQNWIVLADTKAGLGLAISGVVAGFVFGEIGALRNGILQLGMTAWTIAGIVGMAGYIVVQTGSFIYALRVFFPRTLHADYNATRHVFPVGLASAFPKISDRDRFHAEFESLSVEDFRREYAYQLHIDSLVCGMKYSNLRMSLKLLFIALALGLSTIALIALTMPLPS